MILQLQPAPPAGAGGPAASENPLQRIGIADFAAAAAKAKGVDAGVSLLIQKVNQASAPQLANVLQQYNLVSTPELANSEASRLIDLAKSKESWTFLIALRAGIASFVILDTLAPTWSFTRKATISLVLAAVVAALIFYGVRNEATPAPAITPAAPSQPPG